MPLTPEDVRNKQFTTVRLREGYDEDEVDAFLDEVEAELTRLLRENEDLRAKLAAATRAAAQNQQNMRKPPEQQDQQQQQGPPPGMPQQGMRGPGAPVPAGISGPPQQQMGGPMGGPPQLPSGAPQLPAAPADRAARRVPAPWARVPGRWARAARCRGRWALAARWAVPWAVPVSPVRGSRWRQRRARPVAGPADRRPGDRGGPFRGQQDRGRGAFACRGPRA